VGASTGSNRQRISCSHEKPVRWCLGAAELRVPVRDERRRLALEALIRVADDVAPPGRRAQSFVRDRDGAPPGRDLTERHDGGGCPVVGAADRIVTASEPPEKVRLDAQGVREIGSVSPSTSPASSPRAALPSVRPNAPASTSPATRWPCSTATRRATEAPSECPARTARGTSSWFSRSVTRRRRRRAPERRRAGPVPGRRSMGPAADWLWS
jgi:hypothetical protein